MTRATYEMFILLAISIGIAFIGNAINPNGIPLFGQWDPQVGEVHAGGPCASKSEQVNDLDVLDYYLSSEAVFVDARSRDDYAEGHIPRAYNLPLKEVEDLIYDFLDTYTLDTPVITYCSGVECHDSHELAEALQEYGFTKVLVYSQGMNGWKAQNRPVENEFEPEPDMPEQNENRPGVM